MAWLFAYFMFFPTQTCYYISIIFLPLDTYTYMKKIFSSPIDLSKVNTLIYHLPDGPTFSVEMNDFERFIDLDMEMGDICDTSDIDGVLHFFPKGNA
jgi:hypothetical protein